MAKFFTNLFSAGASNLVDAVGNAIDKNTTSDEERKELENELLKTELQYNVDMATIDLAHHNTYVQDLGSARDSYSRIQESSHASMMAKNIQPVLALLVVALTFGMFFWILSKDPNKATGLHGDMKEIIIYILGALTTISTQVVAFYFGSSQGSKDKQRSIDAMKLK